MGNERPVRRMIACAVIVLHAGAPPNTAITARKPGRGRASNLNQVYQVRYFGELDGSDWLGRRALINRGLHDMVVEFDSRFALPAAVDVNTA